MKLKANDYQPNEIMRIIREWSEMTQREFGKTIGKAERTIQGIELGKNGYSMATLLEVAKKHDLTITIEKKSKFGVRAHETGVKMHTP